MGDLYVDVNRDIDLDYCRMPVHSAITLFVYKFCQIDERITIHFVTVQVVCYIIEL